jgi:hypothetical protein
LWLAGVVGDGFERIPQPYSPPRLHLDEYEGVMVAHDQIQLPVTGSVVALDEGVSSPPQVAQGELFAPRP